MIRHSVVATANPAAPTRGDRTRLRAHARTSRQRLHAGRPVRAGRRRRRPGDRRSTSARCASRCRATSRVRATATARPTPCSARVTSVLDSARGYLERGVASWYGTKFNGRATSSGELYDICAFTAAHKTLPLPSFVRVTNLDNGRSLIVRVNDRGPFHDGRVMDLSYAAAVRLGVDRTGTARVELEAVGAKDWGGTPVFAAKLRVRGRGSAGESVVAAAPAKLRAVGPTAASGAEVTLRPGSDAIVQVGAFADQNQCATPRRSPAGRRRRRRRRRPCRCRTVATVWRVRDRPAWPVRRPERAAGRACAQLDLPEPRVVSE